MLVLILDWKLVSDDSCRPFIDFLDMSLIETLKWQFVEIILYYLFKFNAKFSLIPKSLAQASVWRCMWRKLITLVRYLAAKCPYTSLYQQIWYEIWYLRRPQQKDCGVKRKIQGNSSLGGWMHTVTTHWVNYFYC